MRTTIDLPDDVHRLAKALARDQGRSLSETVGSILRDALLAGRDADDDVLREQSNGLLTIHLGTTITSEDVASLDDDV